MPAFKWLFSLLRSRQISTFSFIFQWKIFSQFKPLLLHIFLIFAFLSFFFSSIWINITQEKRATCKSSFSLLYISVRLRNEVAVLQFLDFWITFIVLLRVKKKKTENFFTMRKKREVAVLPKWCCIISKNYVSFTVWKTMKLLLFLFFAKQFFFFLLYKTFRNIIFLFCWERLLRWEFFLRVFYIWIWLLKRNLWFSFWRRVSAWHFFAGSFDDLSGCCELEKCEVVSIQRYLEHFAAFSVFNHNLFWRIQTMRFCGFSKIDQSLFFEGTRLLKNQQLLWNFWVVCTLLLSKII